MYDLFSQQPQPFVGSKPSGEVLPTQSPINKKKLGGQNERLLKYLLEGKSIHLFHAAKTILKIGYLNSRISDLIHEHKIDIQSKMITVKDAEGNDTSVKEYLMLYAEIERVKKFFNL